MRKWLIVPLALCLLTAAVAEAKPRLGKPRARAAAEDRAYDFYAAKTWASRYNVGRCSRRSRTRVDCRASAAGEDFECNSDYSTCWYEHRVCRFRVIVRIGPYSPYYDDYIVYTKLRGKRCYQYRTPA